MDEPRTHLSSGSFTVGGHLHAQVMAVPAPHVIELHPQLAICPHHGVVSGKFYCYVTDEPEYQTPKLCPKCYVDWVGSQVQHVVPKETP